MLQDGNISTILFLSCKLSSSACEVTQLIGFGFSGLTSSNYTELSQIYEKYKSQGEISVDQTNISKTSLIGLCEVNLTICVNAGLEILAFPCNQFGGQEPGSNADIKNFACTRFKAEFPIFDKVLPVGFPSWYC